MKNLLLVLLALFILSSCRKKDDPVPGSNEAAVTAITLSSENLKVEVPADGGTTSLANIPHTVGDTITAVPVHLTTSPKATIKIGSTLFTQGQKVDFSKPVTFSVTAENGTTVKNYTIDIKPYNAISNPYGIYTVAHLSDMRNSLKSGFKLMNDLTMPDTTAAGVKATGIADYDKAGWFPIADVDDNNGFKGTFDGGEHTIDNFFTRRVAEYTGLFGKLRRTASIKNLKVKGMNRGDKAVAIGTSPDIDGVQYTGILAGYNEGTIDNCHVSGNVSSSSNAGGLAGYCIRGTISNCDAVGNVSASSNAGGLVGSCTIGTISNCHATGNVSTSGSYSMAGGLAGGGRESTINNCYATGKVSSFYQSGGLVGYCYKSTINNCQAVGNEGVSSSSFSSSYSSSYAGGLVGYSIQGTINNCYAVRNVSSSSSSSYHSDAGGLVGYNSEGTLNNCYAAGNVSSSSSSSSSYSSSNAGGLVGYNTGSTLNNCYALGNVSSSSSSSSYAGGLVGEIGYDKSRINNCYAVGNVSSSSSSNSYQAGGLVGDDSYNNAIFNNCYRKSDATIMKNNVVVVPDDTSTSGITPQTLESMKTDAFKGLLNGVSGTAWGYSTGKNDDLPYLIGVGVGK